MNGLFSNSNGENNMYQQHNNATILGRIVCYRNAIETCRLINRILERNNISELDRIISLRRMLIRSKDKYKHYVRNLPYNDIYREMLGFVRSLVVMYNSNNLDGMKEVLRWKIGVYNRKLGDLNAIVNNHTHNDAFTDITRTTNNSTNIAP